MKMNTLCTTVVAGLLMLGASLPSQAIPISWTLNNVTFGDGATASGSFMFDASTHTSSSYSVSFTGGILSDLVYDAGNSDFSYGGFGANSFIVSSNDGHRYFNFAFTDALTDAGGIVQLLPTDSYECANCSPFRLVVSGEVTAQAASVVPEPASLALVVPTLGMLAFLTRRRKNSANT
jgi:hypothetical protein